MSTIPYGIKFDVIDASGNKIEIVNANLKKIDSSMDKATLTASKMGKEMAAAYQQAVTAANALQAKLNTQYALQDKLNKQNALVANWRKNYDAAKSGLFAYENELSKVVVAVDKVGVAGIGMGEGVSRGASQGIGKLVDMDRYASRIISRWGKFIVASVMMGGGVKVIMELSEWTKNYSDRLNELAKGHDLAAFTAREELAAEQQSAAQMKELQMAVGGLVYNFKVGMTDAIMASTKAFGDATKSMEKAKGSSRSFGETVGWLIGIIGKFNLVSFGKEIGEFIGRTIGTGIVVLERYVLKLVGLYEKYQTVRDWMASFGGKEPQPKSWGTDLGMPYEKYKQATGSKPSGVSVTSEEETKKRTEAIRKYGEEVKKANEAAAEAILKHTKALEANDAALVKLVAEYGGLTGTNMPEYRNNLQVVSDLQAQLGTGLQSATEGYDIWGSGATENSTKAVEGMVDVSNTTEDLAQDTIDWGETIATVMADAISAVGGYFSALVGGESKLAGMMGKMGGGLGAAWFKDLAKNMGSFGKTIMPIFGEAIGSVVGSVLGKIISLFKGKPEWKKLGEQIGKDLGYSVSEELAKKILETSKKIGKDKAIAQNFAEIVGEITNQGQMDKAFKAVIDQLGRLRAGLISTADLAKSVGTIFAQMTDVVGDHIDATIIKMIQETKAAGLEVKEISDYVKAALGEAASGISQWGDALKQSLDAGKISLEQYTAEMTGLREVAQITFDAMILNGSTMLEAWNALGGVPMHKVIEANKELLTVIESENTAMKGLFKSGQLGANDAMKYFTKFQNDAVKNYDKLIAGGMTQNQALQAMAPTLRTVVEASKQYGFTIDANTQKLIDQAVENGVLGKDQLTMQESIEKGFAYMLKALGSDIPAAWQKYIDAANEAAAATDNVASSVGLIGGGIPKYKGNEYEPEIPAAQGFHGFVNSPTRFLVGEGGRRERVDIDSRSDNRRYSNNLGGVTINVQANTLDELISSIKRDRGVSKKILRALNTGD